MSSSQFPTRILSVLLHKGGWPKTQGRFKKLTYVHAVALDATIDATLMSHMVLGAGNRNLALSLFADIYRTSKQWDAGRVRQITQYIHDPLPPAPTNEDVLNLAIRSAPWQRFRENSYAKRVQLLGRSPLMPYSIITSDVFKMEFTDLAGVALGWALAHPHVVIEALEEMDAPSEFSEYLEIAELLAYEYQQQFGPFEIPSQLLVAAFSQAGKP